MAFYTYTILTGAKTVDGSIKQWLNNSSVPAVGILAEAQAWIYQRLRVRGMLVMQAGSLGSAVDVLALPARFRQSALFMFTGVDKAVLTKKTYEFVKSQWAYDGNGVRTTGKPTMFAASATELQFDFKTNKAYTYDFSYYAALTDLSASTGTNFLTDEFPSLLKAACLVKGYEYLKDQKNQVYWQGISQNEIYEANKDSDMELSGIDLAVRIDAGELEVGLP